MASQRDRTLDLIRHAGTAGITTYRMAQLLDAPAASIRRNIQELRVDGHDIVFGNGFFRHWGTIAADSRRDIEDPAPATV